MRYLVKVNELAERIDYLLDQIKIIEDNIEELNIIKTSIVWEGEAAVKFSNNYNKYLSELTKIEDHLMSIIKFLIGYHDRYGNAYKGLLEKYRNIGEIMYGEDNI